MANSPGMTPRAVRLELNRIETWVRKHEEDFTNPEDLLMTRALIEVAHTETHLTGLRGFLREVME